MKRVRASLLLPLLLPLLLCARHAARRWTPSVDNQSPRRERTARAS